MKYLLAICFPFMVFFILKQPIKAYFSLILSLLAIILSVPIFYSYNLLFTCWLLLALWSFVEINEDNNQRNIKRLVKRIVYKQLKQNKNLQNSKRMKPLLNDVNLIEQNQTNYNKIIADTNADDLNYHKKSKKRLSAFSISSKKSQQPFNDSLRKRPAHKSLNSKKRIATSSRNSRTY